MVQGVSIADKNYSALIVEPSVAQAKFIGKSLSQCGVAYVDTVDSLERAKALIATSTPDIVASAMYFADGESKHLREFMLGNEAYADIPFILISSETDWTRLDVIKQSGVAAVLSKPFTQQSLQTALASIAEIDEQQHIEEFVDLKVLLVDDSAYARRFMRGVLESIGIEHLTEAEDGLQALDALNQSYFDLVVSDYHMPNMDGEALLKEIRSRADFSGLPVLMVTSENNQQRLEGIQQAGVSALCDKPFDTNEVRKLLTAVLN